MSVCVVTHAVTLASFVLFVLYLHGAIPHRGLTRSLQQPYLAASINLGLVALWSLQHSGMASLQFKEWTRRFVPIELGRTLYCASTSVALVLIVFGWAPISAIVFDIEGETSRAIIQAVFWLVWSLFFLSLVTDSYLEFFGLEQAWCHLTGRRFIMSSFRTDGLYQYVRHPSLSLIILGLWLTPVMTVDRLMLTVLLTAYTVVGAWSVDRKYVLYYGEPYVRRRQQVPLLIPRLTRQSTSHRS